MSTLIVSDVHLGSSYNRAKDLTAFIDSVNFERLIILGDLFDRPDLSRLRPEEWDLLSAINGLSEYKDVIWVEGNHDEKLNDLIPSLLNIKAVKEFRWKQKGKEFIALHGHQFDDYTTGKNRLTSCAGSVYRFLRRIDLSINRDIFHHICYGNSSWRRLSDQINKRALEYAHSINADFIFCGHTHRATNISENGIEYFNTGCWNDRYCHYVLVDGHSVSLNMLAGNFESKTTKMPNLRFRHAV